MFLLHTVFPPETALLLSRVFWKAISWVNCPNTQMTRASLPTRMTKSWISVQDFHFVSGCQGMWWAEQGCDCCCCVMHGSSQDTGCQREMFLLPLTFNMKNNWLFRPYYWTLQLFIGRIITSIVLFYFFLPHYLFVLLYKIQEYKLCNKVMNWGQINDYHCLGNKTGHYKLIEVCGFSCLLIVVGLLERTGSHLILH